jgi:tRNA G18 (ribose-2'-O)-methylase SpoU
MVFVPLASPDDPRFEPYRELRDRDVRGRDASFIVEGEVVLRVLLARNPERVRSVLILDKRRDKLADALVALADDVPVYLASEAVMSEVVGFPIHRGILALASRAEPEDANALLARLEPGVVLGVCGVTNHDNVGGIFRNAAAFGARAVLFDKPTCDPLYRKAIRVSVGATLAVPFAQVEDEAAMLAALEAANYTVFGLTPRGTVDVAALPPLGPKVALVLGAEGTGLSEATLARVTGLSIRMAPGWDSLNVAASSAVALHACASRAQRTTTRDANQNL